MVILKLLAVSVIVVFLTLASLFGYGSGIRTVDDLIAFLTGETVTYFRVEGTDFCVKNVIRAGKDKSADLAGKPIVLATFVQSAEIIDCDAVDEGKLVNSKADTVFVSGELKSSQYISSVFEGEGVSEPILSIYNEGEGIWYNQEKKVCLNQKVEVESYNTAKEGVELPILKKESRIDVFCKAISNEKGQ